MTRDEPRYKVSNTNRARSELRLQIIQGALRPGECYLESDLADRLGMSRTPVREAALTLQTSGLVDVVPRRGIRIRITSADDLRETYDILTELEGLASQRAARRVDAGTHDPAALSNLGAAADVVAEAGGARAADQWLAADEAFHEALLALANSPRLARLLGMMSDQVHLVRGQIFRRTPPAPELSMYHRQLVCAIGAGDPIAATNVNRAYLSQLSRELVARLRAEEAAVAAPRPLS